MKTIYLGMTADILHHGHINIIARASELGELTIGLLTDEAIADHKKLPMLNWEQRKSIIENIKGVYRVIPQDTWDYSPTLYDLKPDVMVHGTDWLEGPLMPLRRNALEALNSFGGELIEIPYTEGVSSSTLALKSSENGILGEVRTNSLRRLLSVKNGLRILEAHDPISAILVEESQLEIDSGVRFFDGIWSSSLTDSTSRGMPDTEALSINARLSNIGDIFSVTTKPLIFDADTGGATQHFALNVKKMDRLGISACIIEDKKGLKKNSLLGNEVEQHQETIEDFCEKITVGRESKINPNFMIIARIESLILDKGMDDATYRAFSYVDAGADGIMIHSRKKDPDEVLEFARIFREKFANIPLVVVPTTFNKIYDDELFNAGFNIVIYANHLLRAAVPAMRKTVISILENRRSLECENEIEPMRDVLNLIPGTN